MAKVNIFCIVGDDTRDMCFVGGDIDLKMHINSKYKMDFRSMRDIFLFCERNKIEILKYPCLIDDRKITYNRS